MPLNLLTTLVVTLDYIFYHMLNANVKFNHKTATEFTCESIVNNTVITEQLVNIFIPVKKLYI